ncbi:hypothetical protein KSP40_PGU018715 [Platanthera guangdongensis]|uniref:Uncharacterized protein n=1 Tax=Platanthera guangdongensis TaxID=2320717 RepID=A0ABR2MCS0_9ASPA
MSALFHIPSHPAFAASPSLGFFDPVTDGERDSGSALSRRIDGALRLLDLGREFQAKG